MAGALYRVLAWAREHGEPRALERIRLKMVKLSVREGINLAEVEPDTKCSAEYLEAIRNIASEVVGAPCPH